MQDPICFAFSIFLSYLISLAYCLILKQPVWPKLSRILLLLIILNSSALKAVLEFYQPTRFLENHSHILTYLLGCIEY